jgi:hypothetical protein
VPLFEGLADEFPPDGAAGTENNHFHNLPYLYGKYAVSAGGQNWTIPTDNFSGMFVSEIF